MTNAELHRNPMNPRFRLTSPRRQQRGRLIYEPLESRLMLYNLAGSEWANTDISFSYVPDGTSSNGYPTDLFAELNAVAPTATWQREFARALQSWAEVANLDFHEIPDDGSPILTIGNTQGDSRFGDIRLLARSAGGLATASYPPTQPYGYTDAGDIMLNSDRTFDIGSHPDLYSVLLHESGHALGLAHSTSGTVMYGAITGVYTGLTSDDIAGIRAIYGARIPDRFDATAPNGSRASATTLAVNASGGTSVDADLTTRSDVDYYRVTAPNAFDGTLTVSVDARGLSLLAPRLSVYDMSGNQLATDTAGNNYGTVATVNLSGLIPGQTYYLMADGASNDPFGIGAYQMDVQFGGGEPATPGISVNPTSGLTTSELGGTAEFQVVLQSQPTDQVVISVSSSNSNEGVPSATSLTFTSSNWNTPQVVTVTGVDDTVQDGDVGYTIFTGAAVSSDGAYHGRNAADVFIINLDDDASEPPSPELSPDRFEVNDSFNTATDFGTTNGTSEAALSIHMPTDQDYFSFVPRKGGVFEIATRFSHANGDLDLHVYDAAGNLLASSTTRTNNEQVSLTLNTRERYYFRVSSSAGDTNTHDISVTKIGASGSNGRQKTKSANLLDALQLNQGAFVVDAEADDFYTSDTQVDEVETDPQEQLREIARWSDGQKTMRFCSRSSATVIDAVLAKENELDRLFSDGTVDDDLAEELVDRIFPWSS